MCGHQLRLAVKLTLAKVIELMQLEAQEKLSHENDVPDRSNE